MNSKCLLIMLDGLGDRAHEALGNRTPLQKARTPALDRLARLGSSGLYHPGLCGQCFPSETAHMIIFGYDMNDFPGRGPLEALGADIPFARNDVVIMTHLACAENIDGLLILKDGKPDIGDDEARMLFESITNFARKEIKVTARQIKGISGVIIISGDMSPHITDSDPVDPEKPVRLVQAYGGTSTDARAVDTADTMNSYIRWAHHVLSANPVNAARKKRGQRPVNVIVTQRAGRLKQLTPIREKYGLRSLSISSSTLYRGIGSLIGMDHVYSSAPNPADDMAIKLSLAMDKFRDYDFIHVHTKEPDEAGHRKDPVIKSRVIEQIDRGIRKALPGILKRDDLFVVVMADHSTPSSGPLIHSGEPVPVIFYGRGTRRDGVRHYDEISAARGAAGLLRGNEIILSIINGLDRSVLLGFRDNPADLPYWPGKTSPLKIEQE